MNSINSTSSVTPVLQASPSSKTVSPSSTASMAINRSADTAAAASVAPVDGGKVLPHSKVDSAAIKAADEAAKATDTEEKAQDKTKTLELAVETANNYVQTVQRDLHFSIDQESERTVVKVVESSSGDIIRQIPNESFLELARKMKELGEVSLVDATG